MCVNSKISCKSTLFRKETSILSHITKSYRPSNFCKTDCPKKPMSLKSFDILKTVLVFDLTFQF